MTSFPADLRGRIAVVTGAAMGMGRTLSLRLAKEGCHLALCDLDIDALEGVRRECEAVDASLRVTAHRVDVSQREEIRKFGADVVAAHGNKIHLLFNNAGIQIQQPWDRMSEEAFDKVMAVDLDGVVTMTRVFWPHIVAADAAYVVNTSSVAGFMPKAGGMCVPYAVSKYAVRGFSEVLMTQLPAIAPHVRVAVVHPGAIQTEIVKKNMAFSSENVDARFLKAALPAWKFREFEALDDDGKAEFVRERFQGVFDRWGYSAEQAADMIVDGVKAGKTRIMVGWDAVIMDWWVRAFPRMWNSQVGGAVIMLTSIVGRHFYLPAAGLLAAGAAASCLRSRL